MKPRGKALIGPYRLLCCSVVVYHRNACVFRPSDHIVSPLGALGSFSRYMVASSASTAAGPPPDCDINTARMITVECFIVLRISDMGSIAMNAPLCHAMHRVVMQRWLVLHTAEDEQEVHRGLLLGGFRKRAEKTPDLPVSPVDCCFLLFSVRTTT